MYACVHIVCVSVVCYVYVVCVCSVCIWCVCGIYMCEYVGECWRYMVCIWCVYGVLVCHVCVQVCACVGQRIALRKWFFPVSICDLRIKLRLSGPSPGAYTH